MIIESNLPKNIEREFHDKYSFIPQKGLDPILDTVLSFYMYLMRSLNSYPVLMTLQPEETIGANQVDSRLFYGREEYKKAWFQSLNLENWIKLTDEFVFVKMNLTPIPFKLGFGVNSKANEFIDQFLDKMIGNDFKLPEKWTRNNQGKIDTEFAPVEGKMRNLKWFIKNKVDLRVVDEIKDIDFEVSKEFLEYFEDFVYVKLNALKPANHASGFIQGNMGQVASSGVQLNFLLYPEVFLKFPIDYAKWVLDANKKEDILQRDLLNFLRHYVKYYSGSETKKPPVKLGNIVSIYNRIQTSLTNGLEAKKKTNRENLGISNYGKVLWIPEVDRAEEYVRIQKSMFDPVTGFPNKNTPSFKNKVLMVDWVHDRCIYANREKGELITIDLSGMVPLDRITIWNMFQTKITATDAKDYPYFSAQNFFTELHQLCVEENIRPDNFENIIDIINILTKYQEKSGDTVTFASIVGGDEISEDNPKVKQALKDLFKVCQQAYPKLKEDREAVTSMIEFLKPGLTLIAVYGLKFNEYRDHWSKQYVKNNPDSYTELDSINVAIDIPNAPNIQKWGLMPHQASTLLTLNSSGSRLVMLDIDAGGGKTLTAISYILMQMASGKAKRPIVIVPSNLVKEFINDVNTFCNDKVNVVAVTAKTVKKMVDIFNASEDNVVEYLRGLPSNTIYITDYNFLQNKYDLSGDRVDDVPYLGSMLVPYPKIELMNKIGFDMVVMDESHKLKNRLSSRSEAISNFIFNIPTRVVMSGTIISNTPVDVVNQSTLLNPGIFRNENAFTGEFALMEENRVVGWRSNLGGSINDKIRPYAVRVVKKRPNWAFILPSIEENLYRVDGLMPIQQRYYNNLEAKAIEDILKDEKLQRFIQSSSAADDDKIANLMKTYFQKVELFVLAPDADPVFVAMVGEENQEELISPKVRKIDDIIDDHFLGGSRAGEPLTADTSEPGNKLMVFFQRKEASKHFMRWTRHKESILHYTSGNLDIIDKFRDPNNRKHMILVADETSIQEGHNLQIASHLIRAQNLWTPGSEEQSLARYFRPDVRDEFKRTTLRYSVVITSKTLEVAKAARMFSKMLDKAKVDNSTNPRFPRSLSENTDLSLIKMNLQTVAKYREFGDLIDYFEAYNQLREWEGQEFVKAREKLKQFKERQLNRKIDDVELKKLAMVPVTSNGTLPGSRVAYTPWVAGVKNQHHVTQYRNLNLTPISIIMDSDGEDDEYEVEDQEVISRLKPGTPCLTEYGLGRIVNKGRTNIIGVQIKGLGKFNLNKSVVLVAEDPKSEQKLEQALIQQRTFDVKVPFKIQQPLNQETEDSDVSYNSDQPEIEEKPEIELIAGLVNGIPSVYYKLVGDDKKHIETFVRYGFIHVPNLLTCKITHYNGLQSVFDYLQEKGLEIETTRKANIIRVGSKLRSGDRGQILFTGESNINKNLMMNFFKNSLIMRVKDKKIVNMFALIIGESLYLALSKPIHDARAVQLLKQMPKMQGLTGFKTNQDMAIKFYTNPRLAMVDIENLKESFDVVNLNEVKQTLKNIRLIRGE